MAKAASASSLDGYRHLSASFSRCRVCAVTGDGKGYVLASLVSCILHTAVQDRVQVSNMINSDAAYNLDSESNNVFSIFDCQYRLSPSHVYGCRNEVPHDVKATLTLCAPTLRSLYLVRFSPS